MYRILAILFSKIINEKSFENDVKRVCEKGVNPFSNERVMLRTKLRNALISPVEIENHYSEVYRPILMFSLQGLGLKTLGRQGAL